MAYLIRLPFHNFQFIMKYKYYRRPTVLMPLKIRRQVINKYIHELIVQLCSYQLFLNN